MQLFFQALLLHYKHIVVNCPTVCVGGATWKGYRLIQLRSDQWIFYLFFIHLKILLNEKQNKNYLGIDKLDKNNLLILQLIYSFVKNK